MNPYNIALTLVPGMGSKTIRQLMTLYSSTEEVFSLPHSQLRDLFGHHENIIQSIESKNTLHQAEQEVSNAEKYGIDALFFTEPDYPQRLNEAECADTPVLLYRLGHCDLNPKYSVAFVGSRKCTDYGRRCTHRLIEELKECKPLIVSGLAYGIDAAAHDAALDVGLPTVAVLGHGLDTIYPSQNRVLAKKIVEQGGALITEYPFFTKISPTNFPARNRIVAALSDAVVVTEAAAKGGALITANIASGYQHEVFAVPGRLDDLTSEGCNNLIVNNRAIMIRNAGDLYFQMGWNFAFDKERQREQQQKLFETLDENEQTVVNIFHDNPEMTLDDICTKSGMSLPKIASIMMNLELKKVVVCLPGRIYKLS